MLLFLRAIQALHKLPLVCFDCLLALSQCLCFVCVSVFVISQAVMHRLVCACVLISFEDGKKTPAIFNFAAVAHMSSSCLILCEMFSVSIVITTFSDTRFDVTFCAYCYVCKTHRQVRACFALGLIRNVSIYGHMGFRQQPLQ